MQSLLVRVHVLEPGSAAHDPRVVRARLRAVAGLAVLPKGVAAAAFMAVLQRKVLVVQAQPPALLLDIINEAAADA